MTIVLELVAALVMIIVGAYLTISQTASIDPAHPAPVSVPQAVAGTALGTLGSILFSWVLAALFEKAAATSELRSALKPISVNIGQNLGSIQNLVRQSWSESELGGVRRSLREAAEGIRLQVSHVQSLIGEEYAAGETDKTLELLDEHRKKLDTALREGDERGIEEARQGIAVSVSELKKTFGATESHSVDCPYCGVHNDAQIRNQMGATAHIRCANCQRRFRIHRNAMGFVTSKIDATSHDAGPDDAGPDTGTATTPPDLSGRPSQAFLMCPSCQAEIAMPRHGTDHRIVCLNCGASNEVGADGRLTQRALFRKEEVTARVLLGSRLFSACPDCDQLRPLLLKRQLRRFGFCHDDAVIIWSDDPVPAANP